MFFEYKNEETGEIIERDFPFGETPPPKVEYENKIFYRYWGKMRIIWGSSFHNEGEIKFKRPPLEAEGYEYT